jgi:transposase
MVVEQGGRATEVARSLGIGVSLLESWIKNFKLKGTADGVGRGSAGGSAKDKERIKQLEKEVERLRMERDILKKAAAYFAKESL